MGVELCLEAVLVEVDEAGVVVIHRLFVAALQAGVGWVLFVYLIVSEGIV